MGADNSHSEPGELGFTMGGTTLSITHMGKAELEGSIRGMGEKVRNTNLRDLCFPGGYRQT